MVGGLITFVIKSYYIFGEYYIYGQFSLHLRFSLHLWVIHGCRTDRLLWYDNLVNCSKYFVPYLFYLLFYVDFFARLIGQF